MLHNHESTTRNSRLLNAIYEQRVSMLQKSGGVVDAVSILQAQIEHLNSALTTFPGRLDLHEDRPPPGCVPLACNNNLAMRRRGTMPPAKLCRIC
ncbi:MAG: hypothetical protein R3C05_03255 [Pirellulaceae bacterium]